MSSASEPLVLQIGDTWTWRRDDLTTLYPATSWTLTYSFVNSSGQFSVTASADGLAFAVSVAAATTAGRAAGAYSWVAKVSCSPMVVTVSRGTVTLLPDLSTYTTGYDVRTHAEVMLDAIESALEGRASAGQLDLLRKVLNSQQIDRDVEKLITLRNYYRSEVRREQAEVRAAQGLASGRRVLVQFS